MVAAGGHVVMIDVNTETGGLTLNPDFFVDFGKVNLSPVNIIIKSNFTSSNQILTISN